AARRVHHRGDHHRHSGRSDARRTNSGGAAARCTRGGDVTRSIAEQIRSEKSGVDARAGDMVVCDADLVIGTDASAPMAIAYFEKMGGTRVCRPERVVFALDHYDPTTSPGTAKYHD